MALATWAFEKWEGLGNDFVVLEGPPPSPAQARALCDRRRGVGADGVLAVSEAEGAVARMVVVNADGSRPEMCGNGLRCVAAWLVERGRAPAGAWAVASTDAGPRSFLVEPAGAGWDVTIQMGRATFEDDLVVEIDGAPVTFRRAGMGNPHAIRFADQGEPDRGEAELARQERARQELARMGPRVAVAVDGGTNVELVRGEGRRFEVLVWERGVGPTAACGTGACAVAAVACREGRAPFGVPLEIVLPGGPLLIEVERETFAITMRGPARRAFRGEAPSPTEAPSPGGAPLPGEAP